VDGSVRKISHAAALVVSGSQFMLPIKAFA
jgi:hypothetical protein